MEEEGEEEDMGVVDMAGAAMDMVAVVMGMEEELIMAVEEEVSSHLFTSLQLQNKILQSNDR